MQNTDSKDVCQNAQQVEHLQDANATKYNEQKAVRRFMQAFKRGADSNESQKSLWESISSSLYFLWHTELVKKTGPNESTSLTIERENRLYRDLTR